jgi:GNAT superfamily N-acetyltransferase
VNLLASLDGEPVGAAALDLAGDLAGLYFGAVIPSARRQGIQRALMEYRLQIARDRGCRVATVGTLPGVATERNARRCGFGPCYTRAALVRPAPGLVPSM